MPTYPVFLIVEKEGKLRVIIPLADGTAREGTLTLEVPNAEFPCGPNAKAMVTLDREYDLDGEHEYTCDVTSETYKITMENGIVIEGQIPPQLEGVAQEQYAGWTDRVGIVAWGT